MMDCHLDILDTLYCQSPLGAVWDDMCADDNDYEHQPSSSSDFLSNGHVRSISSSSVNSSHSASSRRSHHRRSNTEVSSIFNFADCNNYGSPPSSPPPVERPSCGPKSPNAVDMHPSLRPIPKRASSTSDASTAEDDGYIVTLMTDGISQESSLVVFDAADVAKGPVAKVPVGVNMPHGLHGCWVPGDVGGETPAQLMNANVLLRLYMRKSKEWNQLDASFSGMGIGQFFGQRGMDGR